MPSPSTTRTSVARPQHHLRGRSERYPSCPQRPEHVVALRFDEGGGVSQRVGTVAVEVARRYRHTSVRMPPWLRALPGAVPPPVPQLDQIDARWEGASHD